jgi:phosphopantetheine--protein transferase-like protein
MNELGRRSAGGAEGRGAANALTATLSAAPRRAVLAQRPRIDIGECDLDAATDAELGEAYALLDAEERSRAAAFVFAIDRNRFVRAHGYLRRRLGAFLGLAPQAVPIVAPKDGKPFVDGHDVDFNLSHSGALAVLAMTDDHQIGIDVELLDWSQRFAEDLDGLAQTCMTTVERQALAAAPGPQRIRRFFAYWTAKEARMKLTGEGFKLDPLEIALELREGEPVAYRRPAAPQADLRFIPLADPNAICCLAVRRDQAEPPGRRWRPTRLLSR